MKKMIIVLALVLPIIRASSRGTDNRQASSGLPVVKIGKLAFESRPWGFSMTGSAGLVTDVTLGEISVMDNLDVKPRILTQGEAPAWAPNGENLAICTYDEKRNHQLQIVGADGTAKVRLTALKSGGCSPDWSPDGKKIAFTLYGGKSSTIAIVDANGENHRTVTEGYDPQWSPDGTRFVFSREVNRKKDRIGIWIVNVDGTHAKKIIEEDTPPGPSISWNSTGPARFYDGNRIVFSSDRAHNWCIFRVNLDGTGLEKVAENNQFDLFFPSFSPDGKQLVVQGDARAVGSIERPEKVILLLDIVNNNWTHLAKGTSPSVLWGTNSRPSGEVILDRASQTSNTSLVSKGRERYLSYKCDECHGANGEGGGDGPDLVGTRLNAEEVSKFLEKPSPDAYMKGMPNIPANHPNHQALVAYVLSLKRPSKPN